LGTLDSPYVIIGDEFEQPVTTVLPDNSCTSCHRAQCSSPELNFDLDRLEMPAPFERVMFSETMRDDRRALREWCISVGLR
jgi:hypothetical protein